MGMSANHQKPFKNFQKPTSMVFHSCLFSYSDISDKCKYFCPFFSFFPSLFFFFITHSLCARRKLRRAVGTADVFILYRLVQQLQQQQICCIFSSRGWPSERSHNAAARAFQVVLIYAHRTKQSKRVPCDTHPQCFKWSQLLHNHVFTKRGPREPDHAIVANLLFPYNWGGRVLVSCSRSLAEMKNPITVRLFTSVSIDSFSMC